MKRITLLLTTVFITAPLSFSNAADMESAPAHQWYVSAFGGYTFAKDHSFSFIDAAGVVEPLTYGVSMEDGYSLGASLGYIFNDNVRFDIEVAHSSNDFDDDYGRAGFSGLNESGQTEITTVLANIWLNANTDIIDPYIGGGVGFGHVDSELTVSNGAGRQLDGSDTGLAAQVGAGVRFEVAENFEIDAGYRLRAVFDASIDSAISGFPKTTDENFVTHTVQVGATFKF